MRKINFICIHHTASPAKTTTTAMIDGWHRANGWSGIGYHYVILHNGIVEKGRPVEKTGAHVAGKNSDSIGIVLCGNFEKETPSPEQLSSLRALLVELKRQYPEASVTWHSELAATLCPGKNLKMALAEWKAMGII